MEGNIANPILLGNRHEILRIAEENNIDIRGSEIIEPEESEKFAEYAEELYLLRRRRGLTRTEADKLIANGIISAQ